ncbi:MAG: D-glycero-beta-D-manno-heptose-7-phosphate kinase [Elusimicrobiota bacterium]|jgi:D-beta-D-heptose 7-phosphate kinase/D-beta-D-heptose 1-phosphate adenosyltransferase
MSLSNPKPLIHRFAHLKALVVGDLMLDHFIWGSVSRISPEAPVPVVEVSRETEVPGGAGNVAANMAVLGAEVHVVGLTGQDIWAERLLTKFQNIGIHAEHILRTPERPTIVKTRIIAQHQQVVRFDRELRTALSPAIQKEIGDQVERLMPHMQAVVISDYAKGVVSWPLIDRLVFLARRQGIPITVDPKVENFSRYRRVTCVTPNMKEAMESAGVRWVEDEEGVERLGKQLLRQLDADSILITRGEHGMTLIEKKKPPLHIPTRAREVYDVTGAGDTVISTLTLALAAGASLRDAAELANYAAGLVVAKLGTAYVTPDELLKVLKTNRHG